MNIKDTPAYQKGMRSAQYLGYALSDLEVKIVCGNNTLAIEIFRQGEKSILQNKTL